MKFVYDLLGRNADRTDKQSSLAIDDNINKFVELSFCIIILGNCMTRTVHLKYIDSLHSSFSQIRRSGEGEGRRQRGRLCPPRKSSTHRWFVEASWDSGEGLR